MNPVSERRRMLFFVGLTIALIVVGALISLRYLSPAADLAQPYTFQTPSVMAPASEEAAKVRDLFVFILVMALVVFVVVEGLLLYAIYTFRNRPVEQVPQILGNTKLEIAWTAAPAVILAAILALTLQTMAETRAPASGDFVRVTAIGHQYWWEFQYPNEGVVTAGVLVVPVNTTIEVEMESVDVEHGFWSPELFGKIDAIPGYTTRLRFTPTAIGKGEYGGQCTQFCGIQHAQMRFSVQVVTREAYEAWVQAQLQPAATPAAGTAEARGAEQFVRQGCVACHVIDGLPGAVGKVGPNLTHVMSRPFIAGGVVANTPEQLAVWIAKPQEVKPGSLMVVGRMDEATVSDLVAYLTSLK